MGIGDVTLAYDDTAKGSSDNSDVTLGNDDAAKGSLGTRDGIWGPLGILLESSWNSHGILMESS